MTNVHTLQQQAQQAILHHMLNQYRRQHPGWAGTLPVRQIIWREALMSWPSLGVLAVTALAVVVTLILFNENWPENWLTATVLSLAIVSSGLVVESLWLGAYLRSEARQQQALVVLLGSQLSFDVTGLRDRRLQAQLIRALQLWGLIQATACNVPSGSLSRQVAATASQATHWLHSAYTLALQTDRLRLSAAWGQKAASAAPVAATLRESMQAWLDQAYQQLDDTVAGLQTVHSQLLLLAAHHGQQPRRTEKLTLDISEEIHRLQDLSAAMAEVYQRL